MIDADGAEDRAKAAKISGRSECMELMDISNFGGTNTRPHILCCEALQGIDNGGQRTQVSNELLKSNPTNIMISHPA
jgi:hypothetical protein